MKLRRFPAVRYVVASNMAGLRKRGSPEMSDDSRKRLGHSQLEAVIKQYACSDRQSLFICQEEKCKALVLQKQYPCHTVQSIWQFPFS